MAGKYWNSTFDTIIYTVEVLSLHGPDSSKFIHRGIRYSKQGDHDRAIRWYDRAVWWSPRNWYAFANRGIARYEKGDFELAKQDLLAAQAIHPSWTWNHWHLGAVEWMLGESEKAIAEWTLALEGGARHAFVYFNRGYAYLQLKQFRSALEDFNEAIKLAPEDAEILNYRSAARSELKDYVGAAIDINKAIELDPRLGEQLTTKIYLASLRGDHKFKVEAYEQLLKENPASSDARNGLAWVLATCPEDNLRNGSHAVDLAKSACELTQFRISLFIDTLAAAYAEAGNFEEAIKWQERAAALYTPEEQVEWGFLIDLYRQGCPYRQPPISDQPSTS